MKQEEEQQVAEGLHLFRRAVTSSILEMIIRELVAEVVQELMVLLLVEAPISEGKKLLSLMLCWFLPRGGMGRRENVEKVDKVEELRLEQPVAVTTMA